MKTAVLLLCLLPFLSACRSTRPAKPVHRPVGWTQVQEGLLILRDGRGEGAERKFQAAQLAARAADDREGIALAAYHVGAARLLMDRYVDATASLEEALAHAGPDDPVRADCLLLLAESALRQSDAAAARTWLGGLRADSPRKDIMQTRLALLEGDLPRFQSLAAALPEDSADALELKAQAASQAGQHPEALAFYAKALERLKSLERVRALPGLLGAAAEAAALAERNADAVDLATRAAGSAYGQARLDLATHWLARATRFAEAAPDAPAIPRLRALVAEMGGLAGD
jgi:tetratricopeptide (TPR) repeat protein